MDGTLIALLFLILLIVVVVAKTAVVVPQQNAFIVERVGRYHATLQAGFHVLFPFIDVIRYKHSLKEVAIRSEEHTSELQSH